MEEIINLLENFGFPVVLVIYLFARFERQLTKLIKSIDDLKILHEKTIEKNNKN